MLRHGFLVAAGRGPCWAYFGVFNLRKGSLYLGDIGIVPGDDVWVFGGSF